MNYDLTRHHRRSIRLRGYDYSQSGAYFITLCVQNHECLFGEIVDSIMHLNDIGKIIADSWKWLGDQYDYVELDESMIMPNHMHGIIMITDGRGGSRTAPADPRTAPADPRTAPADPRTAPADPRIAPTVPYRKPIGRLIGAFKTVSTKRVNEFRKTPGAKLWQRNYWEHIIRNETELHRIRQYIRDNPAQWELDSLNASV